MHNQAMEAKPSKADSDYNLINSIIVTLQIRSGFCIPNGQEH